MTAPTAAQTTTRITLGSGLFAGAEFEVRLGTNPAIRLRIRDALLRTGQAASVAEAKSAASDLADLFARHGLVGWNLEDGPTPVAPTADALITLDIRLLVEAVVAWLRATDPAAKGVH